MLLSISNSETRTIRRFALRALAFLSLQGVIAAAVSWTFIVQAPSTYMARLSEKQERLETTPAPRLVLVGSSNLAFSFDSERAHNVLKLNPINMGLHQGLGIDFVLNQTVNYIRSGDTVLLAIEYIHFQTDSTTDIITESMIAAPRATIAGTSFRLFQKMLDESLALLGRRTRTIVLAGLGRAKLYPEQPYTHNSFNEYGDVVAHLSMPPMPGRELGSPVTYDQRRVDYMIERLNEFAAHCRQIGAHVYFTYPPYPQIEYERDLPVLTHIDERLKKELTFPVISAPGETVYPDDWFYDTQYHTLAQGLRKRTDLVIERLEPLIHATASK